MKPIFRILVLWRKHWPGLAFGAVVSLASLGAALALMALSGSAVAAVLVGTAVGTPVLLRVVGPVRVVLRYAERLISHGATFHAIADLRVWFFRGFAARSAGGLGFRQAGDLLSRLVADVETLDGLYLRILLPLAGALLIVPAAAVLAGRQGFWAALVVTVLLGITAFGVPLLVARDSLRNGVGLAEAASALRIAALDTISGLREVRAFGAEGRMRTMIAERETTLLRRQRDAARQVAQANATALLLGQFALLVMLAASGSASARVAGVFLVVASFEAIALLPRAGVAAGNASAAAQRVLDVAQAAPALAEPAVPAAMPGGVGLRFEDVRFGYGGGAALVFDGLNLEIPAGAHVALLGPSGTGKSTLAALALKVMAPQGGRVLLGGVDIMELPTDLLRRRMAWLGQTTHIFDDSLRANLLLGRPEASDAELWQALDRAAIGEWVRGLPDQLETWLGEGGARVSGGQGRRVALARALLSEAPILLLDEPCAGLDAETERAFFATLYEAAEGRSVLLIAHRLTGAERLDRIYRLSGGGAISAAA
jgi:ATP-binding cassette subfamily C protein CydC